VQKTGNAESNIKRELPESAIMPRGAN